MKRLTELEILEYSLRENIQNYESMDISNDIHKKMYVNGQLDAMKSISGLVAKLKERNEYAETTREENGKAFDKCD